MSTSRHYFRVFVVFRDQGLVISFLPREESWFLWRLTPEIIIDHSSSKRAKKPTSPSAIRDLRAVAPIPRSLRSPFCSQFDRTCARRLPVLWTTLPGDRRKSCDTTISFISDSVDCYLHNHRLSPLYADRILFHDPVNLWCFNEQYVSTNPIRIWIVSRNITYDIGFKWDFLTLQTWSQRSLEIIVRQYFMELNCRIPL
jgi:hypothetical protein